MLKILNNSFSGWNKFKPIGQSVYNPSTIYLVDYNFLIAPGINSSSTLEVLKDNNVNKTIQIEGINENKNYNGNFYVYNSSITTLSFVTSNVTIVDGDIRVVGIPFNN